MLYKDINLIPQKRKSLSPSRIVIYVLLLITFVSYFGNYFVYEPLKEKHELEATLNDLNTQISDYGDIAEKYTETKENYDSFIYKIEKIKDVVKANYVMTDLMCDIFDHKPEDVIVSSYSVKEGTLTISAKSPNYELIGEYMDDLRILPYVGEITYSQITEIAQNETELQSFTLTIKIVED